MKQGSLLAILIASSGVQALEFDSATAFADYDVTPEASPSQAAYVVGYRFAATEAPAMMDDTYLTLANQLFLSYEQSQRVGDNGYITLNGEAQFNYHRQAEEFTPMHVLNTLHYEHSQGPFKARIGKQSIAWGAVAGAPVLDIVSPQNPLTFSTDIAASRVSQWLLSANVYPADNWSAQVFYNPYPVTANAIPLTGETYGGRLQVTAAGADFGLYAGRLTAGDQQTVYGASAAWAVASWLLSADIAMHDDWRLAASAEYGHSQLGSVTATWVSATSQSVHLAWQRSFINDTLSLNVMASGQDGEFASLATAIEHQWQANRSYLLGVMDTKGSAPVGFISLEQQF